ncbi:MAG: hypothetical protein R2702_01545 [Acidimicrobiales bacterium]
MTTSAAPPRGVRPARRAHRRGVCIVAVTFLGKSGKSKFQTVGQSINAAG